LRHEESDQLVTRRFRSLYVAKQEGNWNPWWREYRVQVMGWTSKSKRASASGKAAAMTQLEGYWAVTVPAKGEETKSMSRESCSLTS